MLKKYLFLILFTVGVLIISSCGSSQINTPTATLLSPTRAIDTTFNTPVLNPTETASHTSTPALTSTHLPTITSTHLPTITSTSTHKPSNTPIPTRTPRAEPGLITRLGVLTEGYNIVPLFSPDGRYIILAGSKIQLWDTYTFQLINEFPNPNPEICQVDNASLSTDGSLLAISLSQCVYTSILPGHLLVWEIHTGTLLQDWIQDYATLMEPKQGEYYIPVYALAFLPNSTRIAYASGRTVEIRDATQKEEPVIFKLGSLMYATEISIRDDSEFLYVLMEWHKTNDFPSNYKIKFGVQIWGLNTHDLRLDIDYPEVDYPDEGMELHGENLLHYDYVLGTAEMTNLSTNETSSFLYRSGWKFYSTDLHYMVCVRFFGYDEPEQTIEIWNTDTWRNLYSVKPGSLKISFLSPYDIAFSPDNTILAIAAQGQVLLWDITTVTTP